MASIITRAGKGSPLTNAEVDANFDNLNTSKLELSGGTLTGALTLHADPTSALHAASKQYVDTLVASGIHYHEPVRVEAPINLNATYNNGTAGVGATLTNAGTQAALVIDGVAVATNDRVLIYEQTTATQNGVYVVTDTGSGSTNWVLTRSSDANTYVIDSADGLSEGSSVFVREGTTGAGELYTCNTSGVITFGTTNISFTQISSAQIYSAGAGLTLTGTQFAVAADQLLPSQTGNNGKYLSTDGTTPSWATLTPPNNGTLTLTVAGTGLSGSASFTADQSSNATFTVTSDATSANTVGTIVARDGSGNFSAGTITAALSGNATTATTLETSRTINGVAFNGSANITVEDATKLPLAGGTLSGALTVGGNLLVQGGARETQVALGAGTDLNLNSGNYFSRTISGATTFTVSNVPASSTGVSIIFELTNGGSATVNFWANVRWAGGTAPTLTAAGRDVLGFFTVDNGANWNGLMLAKDIK